MAFQKFTQFVTEKTILNHRYLLLERDEIHFFFIIFRFCFLCSVRQVIFHCEKIPFFLNQNKTHK